MDGRSNKNSLMHFTAAQLGYLTMSLPACATLFAICWSVMHDFRGSTATHCKVYNFLPSISAAIGRVPQRYIWRICISLHAAPRFMYAISYYSWHLQVHVGHNHYLYVWLVKLAVALHFIENFMLVLLTSISSSENKDTHEVSFIVFIVTSWLYMLLTLKIVSWSNKVTGCRNHQKDKYAFKLKKILATVNIGSFTLAVYLYLRHNWYCEPYVYSYFALCEYITIFSNIGFHGTAIIDMREYSAGVVLTELLLKQR